MLRLMHFATIIGLSLAVHPANARETSTFGVRKDPFHGKARMHSGIDLAAPTGTPVYATGDGIVRRARSAGGYGHLVEVEHGFGYQTRFAHLSRILVREGQFVRRGEMIALVGSTGRSTGPHLHYEVRIAGKPVNPKGYMQIIFNTQPDWPAIRTAMYGEPPRPNYGSRTAVMRNTAARRVGGDIEIEFSNRDTVAPASDRVASGFTAGHARFEQ